MNLPSVQLPDLSSLPGATVQSITQGELRKEDGTVTPVLLATVLVPIAVLET
jgi:hypothetical protein